MIRVIAVSVPTECAGCGRPTEPGNGWCSWRCRFADDRHDAFDYRAGEDDE